MQFKQLVSVLCFGVMVVMTGCMMPAKTHVTKDGFTARVGIETFCDPTIRAGHIGSFEF